MPHEIVICAAWLTAHGVPIPGYRHSDCLRTITGRMDLAATGLEAQGFITSKNRFVTREEGLKLQQAAGIMSARGYYQSQLYSEDLY